MLSKAIIHLFVIIIISIVVYVNQVMLADSIKDYAVVYTVFGYLACLLVKI